MDWARILAYVTGTVDQVPLARNEYLAAEKRIMKAQLKGRPKLSDAERDRSSPGITAMELLGINHAAMCIPPLSGFQLSLPFRHLGLAALLSP